MIDGDLAPKIAVDQPLSLENRSLVRNQLGLAFYAFMNQKQGSGAEPKNDIELRFLEAMFPNGRFHDEIKFTLYS